MTIIEYTPTYHAWIISLIDSYWFIIIFFSPQLTMFCFFLCLLFDQKWGIALPDYMLKLSFLKKTLPKWHHVIELLFVRYLVISQWTWRRWGDRAAADRGAVAAIQIHAVSGTLLLHGSNSNSCYLWNSVASWQQFKFMLSLELCSCSHCCQSTQICVARNDSNECQQWPVIARQRLTETHLLGWCHTVTLFNTLSGRSRGKLTVDGQTGGQSEAHIDILPCNSFQHSARHTLFIRRCSDLIRGGCAPLFQSSRLDVNRMAVRVSALPAKRFTSVTGLWHSISAGTCPLPLNVSLQKSDSVTPPLLVGRLGLWV